MHPSHRLTSNAGRRVVMGIAAFVILHAAPGLAQPATGPDERARRIEQRMTDAERFAMLFNLMPIEFRSGKPDARVPRSAPKGAGYTPGVPRLGVPAMVMTDASLGVTSPQGYRPGDTPTAYGSPFPHGQPEYVEAGA